MPWVYNSFVIILWNTQRVSTNGILFLLTILLRFLTEDSIRGKKRDIEFEIKWLMKILNYILVAWFPAYTWLFGSMTLKRNFLKRVLTQSQKASAQKDHRCHVGQPHAFTAEKTEAIQPSHHPQFPNGCSISHPPLSFSPYMVARSQVTGESL